MAHVFRGVRAAMATMLVGAVGSGLLASSYRAASPEKEPQSHVMCVSKEVAGATKPGLPSYSTADIRSHNHARSGGRIWVTYKAGVYDITDFVKEHPGGEKRIMLAAGNEIDKYWRIYTIHDDDAVRDILEKHRIGNFTGYVPVNVDDSARWKNEPERSPALISLSDRPFNASTPEGGLEAYITENELFFVRNHMPVPDLSSKPDFCLKIEGDGIVPRCFSMKELKENFSQHSISSVIQCGGNRRSEMAAAYASSSEGGGSAAKVKGLSWTGGGIGNAVWTGVWLRDLIEACQVEQPAAAHGYHIHFEGADSDAAGNYNVSIPYSMGVDQNKDVLVAYQMNGEPLPRDHGFPLRAVVPGVVGVRNCKWLQRVSILPFEAQSVWQQNDYKNFPSWTTSPDPKYPSVYAMPVQSSITDASYNASTDTVDLKAYAYCGGGIGIQRVEVSFDGGKNFEKVASFAKRQPSAASLQDNQGDMDRKHWAWRQVDASISCDDITATPVEDESGRKILPTCIRAITMENSIQPERAPYNFRGLLYNGYSCKDVVVEE